MSEKKYTILISAISCLLALVLAMCSVTVSHAEESGLLDDNWSYWHVLDNDSTQNGKVDSFGKEVPWTDVEYPDISDFESKDIYNLETLDNTWSTELRAFSFACKDEVSGYIEQQSDGQYIVRIMCLSAPAIKVNVYGLNGKDAFTQTSTNLSYSNWAGSRTSTGDYYIYFNLLAYSTTRAGGIVLAINSQNIKFYDSVDHCYDHLKNGSDVGRIMDNAPKQTYSSELAFTSFDMSVHDSNSFDDYYIDFLYKCPDLWLGKTIKLVINQTWNYNVYYFDIKEACSPISLQGLNECCLSVSSTSVRIYLKDFKCFDEFLSQNVLAGSSSMQKRRILGEGSFSESFSLGGVPIKGSASTVVDKSLLSLSCVVYVDGVAGHEYVGSVDLISGDNSMSTYTPDASGNYTYNNDYKKGGHYYTNVGKDAAGNTTFNYYYYTTDNSRHEVSSQDSHDNTYTTTEAPVGGGGSASGDNSNNNVNNPTFNNNITIEGDNINNDVNNYVGNNTSSETNKNFIEKFLGFFQLLENNSFLGVWGKVFGWLPPGISSVITTALGIGACVGLFRFFRR